MTHFDRKETPVSDARVDEPLLPIKVILSPARRLEKEERFGRRLLLIGKETKKNPTGGPNT